MRKININYPVIHNSNTHAVAMLLNINVTTLTTILTTASKPYSNLLEHIQSHPYYLTVEWNAVPSIQLPPDFHITYDNQSYAPTISISTSHDIDASKTAPILITGLYSLIVAMNYLGVFEAFEHLISYSMLDFDNNHKRHHIYMDNLEPYYDTIKFLNDNEEKADVAIDVEALLKAASISMSKEGSSKIDPDDVTLLVAQDVVCCNYATAIHDVYTAVVGLLSGKAGLIRSKFLGIKTNNSIRAVVSIDLSLKTYQVKMHQTLAMPLFDWEFQKWLRVNGLTSSAIDSSMYFKAFADDLLTNYSIKHRLITLGRQPTLWRFGLGGVEFAGLVDDDDDCIIKVSPLIVDPYNMDFDGDCGYSNKAHSKEAIEDIFSKMFVRNIYQYDHNESFLYNISLDAFYTYKVLVNTISTEYLGKEFSSIQAVVINYNWMSEFSKLVTIDGFEKPISYGQAVMAKLLWQFDEKSVNALDDSLSESDLTRLMYEYHKPAYRDKNKIHVNESNNAKYHEAMRLMNSALHDLAACLGDMSLTLPVEDTITMLDLSEKIQKNISLPLNAYYGISVQDSILEKLLLNMGDSVLGAISKTKFKKEQIKRAMVNIGYVADCNDNILDNPITSNMIDGLDDDEYFQSSHGSRLGIVAKQKQVPNTGYMNRTMVMNNSVIEIVEEDCGSKCLIPFKIDNRTLLDSLVTRYYCMDQPIVAKDVELMKIDNTDTHLIGKTVYLRSPLTCNTRDHKVCRVCFGDHYIPSKYIGIFTGEVCNEFQTQLALRIFHTSGCAYVDTHESLTRFIKSNLTSCAVHEDSSTLTFSKDIPSELDEEMIRVGMIDRSEREINIKHIKGIKNDDIGMKIAAIKQCMGGCDTTIPPILDNLRTLLAQILPISNTQSSYIETSICNLYYAKIDTSISSKRPSNLVNLRYKLNDQFPVYVAPDKKYSIYSVYSMTPAIIGLLYKPNRYSFDTYLDSISGVNAGADADRKYSIYEQIWLNAGDL